MISGYLPKLPKPGLLRTPYAVAFFAVLSALLYEPAILRMRLRDVSKKNMQINPNLENGEKRQESRSDGCKKT